MREAYREKCKQALDIIEDNTATISSLVRLIAQNAAKQPRIEITDRDILNFSVTVIDNIGSIYKCLATLKDGFNNFDSV